MTIGIVLCLLLAGSAVYYFKNYPSTESSNTGSDEGEKMVENNQEEQVQSPETPEGGPTSVWQVIKPVDQTDHVLGNSDAQLTVVLYSDIDCPYCKKFHETMEEVMKNYGEDGTVRWVYRHFPIPQLHPTAPKESEATECVAELGGNTKFWSYLNKLVVEPTLDASNITDGKRADRLTLLAEYAEDVGVNKSEFQQCLDSGKYAGKISQSSNEAVTLGAQGTPFSIVVDKDGKIAPIPGYLPYESMEEALNSVLGL